MLTTSWWCAHSVADRHTALLGRIGGRTPLYSERIWLWPILNFLCAVFTKLMCEHHEAHEEEHGSGEHDAEPEDGTRRPLPEDTLAGWTMDPVEAGENNNKITKTEQWTA